MNFIIPSSKAVTGFTRDDNLLPLSLAQRSVWLDTLLGGDKAAYQLGSITEIPTELDLELATQAVRQMVGCHDAMRLRVSTDSPHQWLASPGEPPVRALDFSCLENPAAAFDAHVRETIGEGFALGDEPLFKIHFVRLGPAAWRVLFVFHHLLADGVSLMIGQSAWLAAYKRLAEPESVDDTLPLPRSTFLPVIADDTAYETSDRFKADIAHFKQRLADLPPLLFEGRPRPSSGTPHAEVQEIQLAGARYSAFAQQAQAVGTTVHRALLSAIAIALSRRYHRRDIVLGNALHRRDASNRLVIGMLAGVLPIRCTFDKAETLAKAVTRLGQVIDTDMRHQRAPIDAVSRTLDIASQRHGGLFDVAVTMLPPDPPGEATLGGKPLSGRPIHTREATPLGIHVKDLAGGGFRIALTHEPNILSALEVSRLAQRLDSVLTLFGTRPATRLAQIDGLTPDERAQLETFAFGDYLEVPETTLPALFAARVAEHPDAEALADDDGSVTYRELDLAAERIAHAITARGIAEGAAIGVAMPRGRACVAALVGILKAGCVYVPLDPEYPLLRRKGMIEDAGASLVFTVPGVVLDVPEDTAIVTLEGNWPFVGDDVPPCPRRPSPSDIAYITFTSGSTGRPKGVAVPHAAAVNLSYARQAHDPIGPGARVLAAISISFDVSFGQLMLPLLRGATIVLADDIRRLSAAELWDFLSRHRVTSINAVPSLFDAIHGEAPAGIPLAQLMLGGEAFPGALARRLQQSLPTTRIVNAYGPTETCIDASVFVYPEAGFENEPVLPIGRPLPNYSMHILDSDGEPVALGALGELHIGGAGLASGYVGAPDLTAAKFVEHPEYGRLYRTGDLASWREDGLVAFHGRIDAQVKIRGFRVELTEIEAAVASYPGVQQVAVIARPSRRGDLRLLCYIVPMADAEGLDIDDLKRHLALSLPGHMIPAAFTPISHLPLTTNGKVDHKALPEPELPARGPGRAAETATEVALAAIVREVIGVGDVVMEDDFFALGGHSLLATQLAARARKAFGRDIPIRLLFETPQIGALAAAIDALAAPQNHRPPLMPRDPTQPAPLSFTQERLWFLDRLAPGSAAYNIPMALRLEGHLDADALARALNALVARHDALRTTIADLDGQPRQVVAQQLHITLAVEDVPEAEVEARARSEAAIPFDLATGPLIRARLLRIDPANHVALITLHHIVSDGWSNGVLMRELAALYAGKEQLIAPLPVQFADYAAWQRSWLTGAEIERQLGFWTTALAEAPEQINLPADRPRPARPSHDGGSASFLVPRAQTKAIAEVAKAAKTSLFVAALAAYAALLARWSGDADLVIGTPIANRTEPATEGLIGFFANTLALRAKLDADATPATLLAQMRAHTLEAFEHQDVPFEKVVEAINPKRDTSRHPLFQVMFVFQNDDGAALAMDGLTLAPLDLGEVHAKFDLTLTVTETQDGLRGHWSYARDLFHHDSIASLGERYVRMISALAQAPETPIAHIDLVTEAERDALTGPWAGTPMPFRPSVIGDLFEAMVAQQPTAVAVEFGTTRLTYADLNARANALAHAILDRGLAPEQPVAVLLPRSEQLVVAAIAIIKAGGVYMPIDPKLPPDRRAYMLADASPALVITTSHLAASLPPEFPALDLATLRTRKRRNVTQADRAAPLTPESLCYLIYTSGSTGQPKAVAVAHGALAHLAQARLAHDPIAHGDRVLAALSVGFDVSVGQLVTPLLHGATIVVSGELSHLTGQEFWHLLRDKRVSHVNSGPAFLDAVAGDVVPGLALKRLMLGGEPFSAALARRLQAALPGVEIFNMYGPSEACIDATCHKATGCEAAAVLPIGTPLPGYRLYILDAAQALVPTGFTGEIYIGGPSLARGYLNRDDLTAERFLMHPAFGRLYRTGDLARWTHDGRIQFAGRADGQVKIRGFRIELGEIETALKTHPAITAAAVLVRRSAGRDRLAAYVVAADTMPDAQALRYHLARTLPDYMIPDAFVEMTSLPLTTNGKVDHKALPEAIAGNAEPAHVLPRNDTDRALLAIWAGLLGHREFGIDDNFFDVGGHSLMALRLLSAIKTQFGVELTVTDLFQRQTVRRLADGLSDGLTPETGPLVPLQAGAPGAPLFCVHPVGGGAMGYLPMLRALGRDVTAYGLQATGFDAPAGTLPQSMIEMAQTYVDAIRRVQPQGPYRLLGHSFGGQVAFAMASLLREAGEEVSHLVMLDTSKPDRKAHVSPAGVAAALQLAAAAGMAEAAGLTDAVDDTVRARLQAVVENNIRLSARFVPAKIDVPVHYVEATGDGRKDGRVPYWMKRGGPASTAARVACGHYEMLSPGRAEEIAGQLTTILSQR